VLTYPVLCLTTALLSASERPPRRAVVSDEEPPVVLMIRSAQTAPNQRREHKLFDELGFALDGFAVVSQASDRSDFAELPLSEQLAAVLPEAKSAGAMVVVWLSFPLNQQVMLHVIAMGSGRALIRTIETNRSPVTEATLALMARELLGTAYLFESPKDVPLAVTEVVEKVKKAIPKVQVPAPPPPEAPPARSPWNAWLRAQANYPLSGGADAVPVWGLGLALEHEVPWHIEAGLEVFGTYASVERPATQGATFFSVGGELSGFRGFEAGSVSVGPRASASVAYVAFQGPTPTLGVGVPSFELGVQARSRPGEGLGTAVTLTTAYTPRRAELATSDGEILFRTASWALMLGFGVGWRGL
jgi:hypothetical protein